MFRLTPLMGDELDGQSYNLLEALRIDLKQAPNLMRIIAKSPAVLQAYTEATHALAQGRLTPEAREQIALATAEIDNSAYCLAAHTVGARQTGLSDEDIRLARRATANDPKTKALLRFTQIVVLRRGDIAEDNLRSLLDVGYSTTEVMEIIANIALNVFTNYLSILSRAEIDFQIPQGETTSSAA